MRRSSHTRFRISKRGFEELPPLKRGERKLETVLAGVRARLKELKAEEAELLHFLKLVPRFRKGGKWENLL